MQPTGLPNMLDEKNAENFGRGIALHREYTDVEERLEAWGISSTVVIFGSARIPTPDGGAPITSMLRGWYDEARHFARIVSERGGALRPIDGRLYNVIATGGGPGIMEAANRGAQDAGAPSIGFNIGLPVIQAPNAYSTPELTFQFHYFAMRKLHLAMRAAALVVFPGGFGTLDELFEILNLVETHKAPAVPIVCFDERFWRRLMNLDVLVEDKLLAPEHLQLIGFADDAETAWKTLLARGLKVDAK